MTSRRLTRHLPREFPVLSIGLATLALTLSIVPGAAEALQFDRTAIGAGAWWRLISGHFVHWTGDHLAWDLAAFLLIGSLMERVSRRLLLATLALATVIISTQVWFLEPAFVTYRGLSGLDSALFMALVVDQVAVAARRRAWTMAVGPIIAFAGLSAKFAFEAVTGQAVFVASGAAFVPVPSAHVAGALAGAIAALVGVARSSVQNRGRTTPARARQSSA